MLTPRKRCVALTFLASPLLACLLLAGLASATPSITLSKKSGPPTSKILVSGIGFEPNVGVDILFDTKDKALVITDGKGEFHGARIYAPRSARPGEHWITALERNNDKGAQQPFLVFTDWPQVGFDPSKSGFNPYENVLDNSTVRSLNLVWSHKVQSSYGFSAIAVADGVVYVAYSGGTSSGLYAFEAGTGAFLWTYPNAVSSPAVKDGVVYVNDSTNLNALDGRTGKLLWKYRISTTGITDAPPTVADGRVFIGAGNGTLYALNATTGKLLWSYSSDAGQIFAAPAVASGIVYNCPGDQAADSSVCYALDEKSGGLLWSYLADGFISGSPAVTDGVVLLDAQYTGVHALDAITGTLIWNYMEDPWQASPAVANGIVYSGGTNEMLALDVYTGAIVWRSPTDNILRCQPAVANGVVYLTSGSGTFYALSASTGDLLSLYSMGSAGSSCPTVANGEVYASGFGGGSDAQLFAFRSERAVH
jgi:outer membrane protein assembly factor BamB